jgi:hypothetical protein
VLGLADPESFGAAESVKCENSRRCRTGQEVAVRVVGEAVAAALSLAVGGHKRNVRI